VRQSFTLSTMSSYSTNTMRGNQALTALTISTSMLLMVTNLYYNNIIRDNSGDMLAWFIMICYSALIFVGLFPSDDIIPKDATQKHKEKLRTWNVFFWTTVPPQCSGYLHQGAALLYLIGPTSVNLHLNISHAARPEKSFLAIASCSIVCSSLFFIMQLILYAVKINETTTAMKVEEEKEFESFLEMTEFPPSGLLSSNESALLSDSPKLPSYGTSPTNSTSSSSTESTESSENDQKGGPKESKKKYPAQVRRINSKKALMAGTQREETLINKLTFANAKMEAYEKEKTTFRRTLNIMSFVVELLAFPLATIQYLFIEIQAASRDCY